MRRRLILTSLFVALMCAAPARAATISFDDLTDQGGGLFTVNMNIADVVDLFTFNLDLIYDPSLVSFSGTAGTFLSSAAPTVTVDDGSGGLIDIAGSFVDALPADASLGTSGLVFGSIFGYANGATGAGLLATLQFQLLTTGVVTIEFANALLFDSAEPFGNLIDAQLATTSLTLGEEAPTPIPEPSTLLLMGVGLASLARRRFGRG
jgi:hypothetical protein